MSVPAARRKILRSLLSPDRRFDIQGLRAIAVTSVVLFHAGAPLPGGFLGVDVFFVISGFVITMMLDREWLQNGAINLRRFYFRRFKRLAPALAATVCATAVASIFLLSPLGADARIAAYSGIGAVLMVSNLVIAKFTGGYFDPSATGNPLLNMWSLSVEEQFYLFFPSAFLIAIAASKRRWITPATAVALIGIASFAIALYGASRFGVAQKQSFVFGFYSPLSRAWEFAAGATLALLPNIAPRSRLTSNVSLTIGLVTLGSCFLLFNKDTVHPGALTLIPIGATCLLIFAGNFQGLCAASTLLGCRPMVWFGDTSYSWYLWHWPIIVLSAMAFGDSPIVSATAVAVSVFVAAASFYWLENPMRRMEVTRVAQAVRIVAATLLPPLAICGLLIFAHSHSYWSANVESLQNVVRPLHAGTQAGCGRGFVPAQPDDEKCLWNGAATGAPIYLIGDSNADHLSEAMISTAERLNRPVRIVTKGGCAFLGKYWSDVTDADQSRCLAFIDKLMNLLGRSKPGTVVLGLSDSLFYSIGASSVGPTKSESSNSPAVAIPYLESELTRLVKRLQGDGHSVILVKPVPKFLDRNRHILFDHARCSTLTVVSGSCPRHVAVSISDVDFLQSSMRRTYDRVALSTGAKTVDLRPALCRNGACANFDHDRILYRDAGHLTEAASTRLMPLFVNALAP